MKYKKNIIKWNLEKYNYNEELFNKYQIQLFMENANNHLISTFKDYLFYDDFSEFLTKFYCIKDSIYMLMALCLYYEKSSYIFPNYTAISEGKYIYKNIIKKQLLINYLEDLEIQKKLNNHNYKIKKNKTKNYNNENIFDGELYNNILINNENNSDLNILFGIKIKKIKEQSRNHDCEENDSINTINKLIKIINESYTKSIGTNTIKFISYKNSKINKENKRNNLSSKGINNSTNHTSNFSNSNITSMFRTDNKINYNNKNLCCHLNKAIINNYNNSNLNLNRSINLNYMTQKNIKINNNFYKFKNRTKINSFLTNNNSSFMKSFMSKIKEKKLSSDKNSLKNKIIKLKTKNLNIKKKQVLTPIEKHSHHLSKMSKDAKSPQNLSIFQSLEINPKINLKYKITKISQKKKNPLSQNFKSISKVETRLNKRVLNYKTYHRHQRNKLINTELNYYNLNNSKKSTFNISLNNTICKTLNMNTIKKNSKQSIIAKKNCEKTKKNSLYNKLLKSEKNKKKLGKEKYFTYNISKKKISINKDEENKKNSKKIIWSYINTKFPSPKKNKVNLIKMNFNILCKNKNKSFIKNFHNRNILKLFKKNNTNHLKK